MLSIIVAKSINNVIGVDNNLPWHLSADLKRFKSLTMGNAVIMGRKTFESILSYLGKPLPGRENIVITRNNNYKAERSIVVHSIEEAIKKATKENVFIIGGAQIYKQSLDLVDRLYITEVQTEIDGNMSFPEICDQWKKVSKEDHQADEKNEYDYSFVIYEKKDL